MAGRAIPSQLPEHLQQAYQQRRTAILARLADFQAITPDDWFYELLFCLMTPQSKAVHAEVIVNYLKDMSYQENGGEVVHLLRDPAHYIRFHNMKAARLENARSEWPRIRTVIAADKPWREKRDELAVTVNGFGLKEASHYLRNIGGRGLAIIDRHLLTNLVECRVYGSVPRVSTPRQYRNIERRFSTFSDRVGIDMDELDLLFWSEMTGLIVK